MARRDRIWNSRGGEEEWRRLVDFIEPSAPEILQIIAKAERCMARITEEQYGKSFDVLGGYSCPEGWTQLLIDKGYDQSRIVAECVSC